VAFLLLLVYSIFGFSNYRRRRRERGGEGGGQPHPLESYSGKFENIQANLKMNSFFIF